MTNAVVVDHDVIGWAYENMQKIKSQYTTINIIGKNSSPEELMNSNISDLNIAQYCLENNCDLITADKKSYIDWFNKTNGINKLIVSKYDYWNGGQRPIIRIQIQTNIDSNDSINELQRTIEKIDKDSSGRNDERTITMSQFLYKYKPTGEFGDNPIGNNQGKTHSEQLQQLFYSDKYKHGEGYDQALRCEFRGTPRENKPEIRTAAAQRRHGAEWNLFFVKMLFLVDTDLL